MESGPDSNEPFYSSNPVVRQQAWAGLYLREAPKIVHAVQHRSPWLDLDDAVQIVHDAFLKAPEYRPKTPGFHPPALVRHFARNRALSLYRRKMAKKRHGKSPAISLDSIDPEAESAMTVEARTPEVWLTTEIRNIVEKLPPLQRAVGIAMIEDPESSASEIAVSIADELGRRPTDGAVDSARTVVRKKLLPFTSKIRRELGK